MPRNAARNLRRLLLSAPLVALLPSGAAAESESVGPWEIEAAYTDNKFDRCAISRKLEDDIVATFVQTAGGLTFLLSSPNWKLERGKQYPVTMKAGPQTWDREVAAEASSVSMDLADPKFISALRAAGSLDVAAAGATIRVPLDNSTAAFARLEQCVDKNERAVATNPFCGPGASAVAGGPEGKAQACQEETTDAVVEPQATGSVDANGEDAPPPPDAKPADGPANANASAETPSPKKAKAKSTTKSTKRVFQREVDRLRRFFDQ